MNVIRILFQRNYGAYIYRREIVDNGWDKTEMVSCYTPSGDWIGDAKWARYLTKKRGITQIEKITPEASVCSIGFNPKEQKWYGWSHRAIYGFGIGSTVKAGDCGFGPSTPQALFESITTPDEDGWAWQNPEDVELLENGVRINELMEATSEPETLGDPMIAMDMGGPPFFDIECWRGEWTAETLGDARQMAVDFADGVS